MENVVWKYPLKVNDHQLVAMPVGARPLCVQLQQGVPMLWALVDPEGEIKNRNVYMLGTGAGSLENPDDYKHIGTVQMDGLVWHYFV